MSELSAKQGAMVRLWEDHLRYEFETKDAAATVATMVDDASVNHVPTLMGGSGREELLEFYSKHFIPQVPADAQMHPISRTVGDDRLVDELVFTFTHSEPLDWLAPGVEPTGKPVELALIVVVEFRDEKLAAERIYWDQASVLVQLGLLDPTGLPVAGAETARKVRDVHAVPSNELIR